MCITTVDRAKGFVVQKITKPNGDLLRYQIVPEAALGDSSHVVPYSTLAEARNAIGKSIGGKLLSAKELAEAAFATLQPTT